jgi:hypothetical protein
MSRSAVPLLAFALSLAPAAITSAGLTDRGSRWLDNWDVDISYRKEGNYGPTFINGVGDNLTDVVSIAGQAETYERAFGDSEATATLTASRRLLLGPRADRIEISGDFSAYLRAYSKGTVVPFFPDVNGPTGGARFSFYFWLVDYRGEAIGGDFGTRVIRDVVQKSSAFPMDSVVNRSLPFNIRFPTDDIPAAARTRFIQVFIQGTLDATAEGKLVPTHQAGGTSRLDSFSARTDVVPVPLPPAAGAGLAGLAVAAAAVRIRSAQSSR